MWSIKCYKSNYKIMMFAIGNYLTKILSYKYVIDRLL